MIRTLTIYPKSRDELREWLMANAATGKEVWVHCIRRQHDTILPYVDLVEEALCFGWIDSTLHSNPDGEGLFKRISPRRKGSHWTELNIERCKRMIAEGRMTETGLKVMPHESGKMNCNK